MRKKMLEPNMPFFRHFGFLAKSTSASLSELIENKMSNEESDISFCDESSDEDIVESEYEDSDDGKCLCQ